MLFDVCLVEVIFEFLEFGEFDVVMLRLLCNGFVFVLVVVVCMLILGCMFFGEEVLLVLLIMWLMGGWLLFMNVVLELKVFILLFLCFVGVMFGSLERSVCRFDMEGSKLGGMVGFVVLFCGLVCFVLRDFGGEGYFGWWWKLVLLFM